MTWIKICGTRNVEDARAAVQAGADAIGFVFAPSPRRIEPERAQEIVVALPRETEKVGVFVNESAERIRGVVETVGLTTVQLQGDETPEFALTLFRVPGQVRRARTRVFKGLGVRPGIEGELRAFGGCVDAVLLDSIAPDGRRGGTGQVFDWNRAQDFMPGLTARTRVILAGGLNPGNVAEAVRKLRPWGVDVCSGVERAPAAKDHEKVRAFVEAVRAASR